MDTQPCININDSTFYFQDPIGSGGQGIIYSATNPVDNTSIAVKVVDTTKATKMRNFIIETNAIQELKPWKYKYLCNILDYFEQNDCGIIAMEKYDCDLFTYAVDENEGLSEDIAKSIFQKICIGLKSMHSSGIAHLDIKPENIMYNVDTDTPYIGDFGSSYSLDDGAKCNFLRGTKLYYPPEYALNEPYYPKKADVYCLGVTLHIILTGFFPYDLDDPIDNRRLCIENSLSPACRNLILRMLRKNPKKRISLKEVMNHSWVVDSIPENNSPKIRSNYIPKKNNHTLHWSLQRMYY